MYQMMILLSNNFDVLSIITLAGGLLSIFFPLLLSKNVPKEDLKKEQKDTAAKIEDISNVLSKSAQDIITIEQELQQRIKKVNELKNQATQAEHLLSISQDQVSAIQQSINQELNKDSKKNFWKSVAVNFVFFLLGAIVSFLISYFFAHTPTI